MSGVFCFTWCGVNARFRARRPYADGQRPCQGDVFATLTPTQADPGGAYSVIVSAPDGVTLSVTVPVENTY